MQARQFGDDLGHIADRTIHVGSVVAFERGVGLHGFVQFTQHTPVIHDDAKILVGINPIHAGNGLK